MTLLNDRLMEKEGLMHNALKNEGSEKYRKHEAQNYMLPGDIEPPIILRTNVLRQAKKEAFDKDLGITKQDNRDLVRSIEEMSLSPQYHGAIQEVCGFPFRVLYGLPTQFHVYQEYRRMKKTWSSICIDATGSLVKKLDRKNGTKSSHIFLYAIVINFNNTTACVYQMLSERHDSVTILTWLLRWIQNDASIPKEVTCDYSRALLIAISMAFNKQSIKSYIHDRFEAISCNVLKDPVTFIRIDVAHFMNIICHWKCFKNIRQRAIKDFYIRCIALMIECYTLLEFEEIFVLTCAVALQTHEDSIIDIEFVQTCRDARTKLENYISKRNINDYSEVYEEKDKPASFHQGFAKDGKKNDDNELDVDNIDANEQKNSIKYWIQNLIAKTQKTKILGRNLNAFYLPDLVEHLTIAKEFPLWTNVGMSRNVQRATSSYVEGYFNDLKTRIFKHLTLPISVNKFIREHIRDIGGTNCILSGKIIQYNNDRLHNTIPQAVDDIKIEETNSDLFAVENWRGKGHAIHFDNKQQNTDHCKINYDIDSISTDIDSKVLTMIVLNQSNN